MIERIKAAKKPGDNQKLGSHFWMQLRSLYTTNDTSIGALRVKDMQELVPLELLMALESAGTANVGARSPGKAQHSFPYPTD